MKIDESIFKLYTIFWDIQDKVLVALTNDKMDYVLRLRDEFKKYKDIPTDKMVDIHELYAIDRDTITVDKTKTRTVCINVLRPEIIPISKIDLS